MSDENAVVKLADQAIVKNLSDQIGIEGMMLLNTIQTMLPKGTSFATLVSCVGVTSNLGLNPMMKEIFYMPVKGGAIQPVISVDGWIKIAQRHPEFNGWDFEPIYEGEGDKRKLIEMKGTMHHKTREHPTVIIEDFEECSKAGGPVWKTSPKRMMRNRTISQLVRVGLGISGVMDQDEFTNWQNQEEEPQALTVIEPIAARDGGDLPRSTKGRPASGAFKDLGGGDKYNELSSQIAAVESVDDLQACFDAFERNGMPWSEFPAGWAKMIQADYQHRLEELQNESEPEDVSLFKLIPIAPDIKSLEDLYDQIPDSAPQDEKDDLEAIYQARMDELEAMQI